MLERGELHMTYISQIERGLKNLSLFNVHRIAEALRVSPAELFTNSSPKRAGR
jgi:transcriptional regulator with XRE-family HTH domain